jgi:hypothetical protein
VNSVRNVLAIADKEVRSYFASPIAYAVIGWQAGARFTRESLRTVQCALPFGPRLVEAVGRNFGMHFNVSNGNRGLEMYKNILHVMRDHTGVDPITWNDVPGRTVKDVFELIDSVIKKVDG